MTILTIKGDAELSAAVAEFVALLKLSPQKSLAEIDGVWVATPDYATSADAVLPLLSSQHIFEIQGGLIGDFYVGISSAWAHNSNDLEGGHRECEALSDTFPRAACLAVLRAKGFQVEFTP